MARMTPGYDYQAPDSVERLTSESIPEFSPNMESVLLRDADDANDFIDWSPMPDCGYIVSKRLREIMESFRLPVHKFFPLSLVHGDRPISGYSWMHIPHPNIAITADATTQEAESIIVESEYANVDLLRLYRPYRFAYCFVTNRLKLAMEEVGITGLSFANPRLFARRLPSKPASFYQQRTRYRPSLELSNRSRKNIKRVSDDVRSGKMNAHSAASFITQYATAADVNEFLELICPDLLEVYCEWYGNSIEEYRRTGEFYYYESLIFAIFRSLESNGNVEKVTDIPWPRQDSYDQ